MMAIQVFEADDLVSVRVRHLCSVSAKRGERVSKAEQTYNLECIHLYVAQRIRPSWSNDQMLGGPNTVLVLLHSHVVIHILMDAQLP